MKRLSLIFGLCMLSMFSISLRLKVPKSVNQKVNRANKIKDSISAKKLGQRYVVIIGVDGLSPDGIQKACTPIMDSLMETGAYSMLAQAVLPTYSSPNWASMLMGVPPSEHEIFSNGWKRADVKGKRYCGEKRGQTWPTIFKVMRINNPEATTATFFDWSDFGRLIEPGFPTIAADTKGADLTIRTAKYYIINEKPDFTFIHIDHVDHAGHKYGHGTAEYYSAVEKADKLIGQIVDGLCNAGIERNTTIIVTSDHGGIGKRHGGRSARERTIPWIINGPNVKNNYEIKRVINTYDTPATALYILGIPAPDCWTGMPVQEALRNEITELYRLK
ncbi:alkaline phosphatase [Fulvivirgaceae bacterium BMA10]|uniref:Alkaline phosphatase n=1 Tax=Splendidivirga corallicola TaxID=3051826 RepID=A0ABT8KW41_9BACT|nr:alkaline phosphatase [Fulvivirgaceae bacterium BMA10]